MERKTIPMSWAEFEVMEHPFGWKVEYWDGLARLTPRGIGVTTKLDLRSHFLEPHHTLIPVHFSYTEEMIAGYLETFVDSVEFCDWPIADIQDSAEKCIHHYLEEKRGKALPASVIALEPDSQKLAGIALFILNREQKPYLDLLYVRPGFQRRGIGTAMVGWGINYLLGANFQELFSAYHICNEQSRQWHHRFGFQDIYDRFYIRLKVAWFNYEIHRRKQLGLLDGMDILTQKREEWKSKVDPEEHW
jgi:GNAT superfamily N-acetyltransferase